MKLIETKSIDELEKIKRIIAIIIDLLTDSIRELEDGKIRIDDRQRELLSFLMGNRENVVSIITKLSNILLKVSKTQEESAPIPQKLDEEDINLIRKYIKEHSNNG